MEEKYRILGIAPYNGMKSTLLRVASKRNDVDFTVFVGDLSRGVEVARKNFHANYDAIISRGETAQLLQKSTSIPVIKIGFSMYDILRAIRLAKDLPGPKAIVGFPAVTQNARHLCDIQTETIDVYNVNTEEEVQDLLCQLKSDGYKTVLCDMIASVTAREVGLNAILITSGTDSIQTAFEQAILLCKARRDQRQENFFLRSLLRGNGNRIVVFDQYKQLYFSTREQEDPKLLSLLLSQIDRTTENNFRLVKSIDGMLYTICAQQIVSVQNQYFAFYISANKAPFLSSKCGIHYTNFKEVQESFATSFFEIAGVSGSIQNKMQLEHISHSPIMVIGEHGTGKEFLAKSIYLNSEKRTRPFITIDCSLLQKKSWDFLIDHHASPLADQSCTIFLKGLESLSIAHSRQLLASMIGMEVCNRNQLIIGSSIQQDGMVSPIAAEFLDRLNGCTICLPPLRSEINNMTIIVSLYLSHLNLILGKQIIGIEPEGMLLLQDFSWPSNYRQLQRVICNVAQHASGSYILAVDIKNCLATECSTLHCPSTNDCALDLNRPLFKIEQDIVLRVLKETDNNQSVAAKRLGISRTTLWRLMKQLE